VLCRVCEEIRRGEVTGANVTMPLKGAAAAFSDRLEAPAARTGAVNTLAAEKGRVAGANTDVDGIRFAWGEGRFPPDAPVLVLGAGGAAAAALVALEDHAPIVSARRPEAGVALGAKTGVRCAVVPWGTPVPGAVVVNATPLGMAGERLPLGVLEDACGLLDMAYGPEPTPAVERARRRGIAVSDGLTMLVGQAARSFEMWTGVPAPLGIMEAAARGR
jgi:shikimate dehydrogenase